MVKLMVNRQGEILALGAPPRLWPTARPPLSRSRTRGDLMVNLMVNRVVAARELPRNTIRGESQARNLPCTT